MTLRLHSCWWSLRFELWVLLFLVVIRLHAFGQKPADFYEVIPAEQPGRMFEKRGSVLFRATAGLEQPAALPQELAFETALRTELLSDAAVRLRDQSQLRLRELTRLEIHRRLPTSTEPVVKLLDGQIRVSSRGKAISVPVETRFASATPKGTEYTIGFDEQSGRTEVTMFDGLVTLSNDIGTIEVTNGWQAIAERGQPPRRARIGTVKVVQWWIDYPGVLDANELELSLAEQSELTDSLLAYRQGDLGKALQLYPGYPNPSGPKSEAGRVYLAGLLLGMGGVERAEKLLSFGGNNLPAARALRTMFHAVTPNLEGGKQQPAPPVSLSAHPSATASEWLAQSYWHQSTNNLTEALACARRAVKLSPDFGFGWARVGELEFSFGRTALAQEAANQALHFSPRNAGSHALKGFLLAAENHVHEAIARFDQAIAIDSSLGNAWLGRGLCKRRLGEKDWLEDIQAAAGLEPGRAVFRSYLGKAYGEKGDLRLSEKELNYARVSDQNDPTSLLYSALLKQQQNRINEAIDDLEESQRLNDNRALFRSEMLLDQDRAVRGANLAAIYRDAGMEEVGVRAATQAVNNDYANYSSHLFLANSYNQLRDPQQINLRYETPWLSEYLLANLLAPVGAGTLSQTISQQEYSKLFERDRFGMASSTEYLSRGDWLQSCAQYGNLGKFGYAVETVYHSENGQRPNNDQEQLTLSAQFKYDSTPQDSFFLQTIYYNASAGDLSQYYDPGNARLGLRTKETQEPLLLAGYRHEWSPGVHTLVVAGRFDDTLTVSDTSQPVLLLAKNGAGQIVAVPTPGLPTASLDYRSKLAIYSTELQQLWQQGNHSLILGARYQIGRFDTDTALGASTPTLLSSMTQTTLLSFASSPITQSVKTEFDRASGYGYYFWRIFEPLQLIGGVAYDHVNFPLNYRVPPTSGATDSEDQYSPKAGLTWTPGRDTTLRFGYTRSLGGVSFDQSVRLEPSQVAGFNQAFRSIIPESVAGSTSGTKFETFGLAMERKFKTRTYLGIEGQLLNSDVNRTLGAVDFVFPPPPYNPSGLWQQLDYLEENLVVTLNQLVGKNWSWGARYQLSRAELETKLPEIPDSVSSANHTKDSAILHQLQLSCVFNHHSGFFAQAEGLWFLQRNSGNQSSLPGDNFWQFNLFGGYRFWQRHAEVQVGVLNLTDQDYRLNPLNLYSTLPRDRTFVFNFQFSF